MINRKILHIPLTMIIIRIMIVKILIIINKIIVKTIKTKNKMLMIYHLINLRKIWNSLNLVSNKGSRANLKTWLKIKIHKQICRIL